MLAVTTFSLSIAVTGFGDGGRQRHTPRHRVASGRHHDAERACNFIGAFLFSLLGLIALKPSLYSASGKVVLYLFTIAVVLLVVVALIRWSAT